MKTIFTLFFLTSISLSIFGQWSVLTTFTGLFYVNDILFIDQNNGYLVGTDAVPNGKAIIKKTTNAGASWTTVYSLTPSVSPSTLMMSHINFVTSSVGYAVGGYTDLLKGIICKTTNGGNSWDTLPHNLNCSRFLSSYFFNTNNGFITGTYIFKTTNGGMSWSQVNSAIGAYGIRKITFINSSTGFAIGNNDNLLIKSTDGGNTWSEVTLPTTENTNDIFFIDQNTGFIGCNNGVILKTNNGGTSWTQVVNNDSDNYSILTIEFATDQIGFAGTLNGKILKTTDAGQTWNENYNMTDSPYIFFCNVNAIDFPTDNTGYAGGTTSYIAKTTNAGGNQSAIESIVELHLKIFPNPASDFVYFESIDGNYEKLIVNIKTIDGKILLSKVFQGDGILDIQNVKPGIYLTEIKTNNNRFTRKLIKI
ncbi:MAG: T9SS type A sorting domain-containing protein [Bacteroidia bacterium]|nr:T9SS type A sorting domain-containing protein [Bacteroidia bacterium]